MEGASMKSLAERTDRRQLERLSDAEVVARVLAGEHALFELIMRRYNRRLFRIARGILRDDAEAEDAVQEAYVSACFKLKQFRGPEGFATWLCQIATNAALMKRRSNIRGGLTLVGSPDEAQADEIAVAELRSLPETPDAALHAHQLRSMLEQAIDELPETYRSAFVMREVEQMSVADTARCLGIEEATVKTRVHRARRLLQRDLTAELAAALTGAYDFDGARCDRIVANVIARLNELGFGG
jgi:RNA polymerase sigma-70 factor (ECF subfamily)